MVDIYSVSEYSVVDQSIVRCIPKSSLLPRELSLSACQPVVVVTHTLHSGDEDGMSHGDLRHANRISAGD